MGGPNGVDYVTRIFQFKDLTLEDRLMDKLQAPIMDSNERYQSIKANFDNLSPADAKDLLERLEAGDPKDPFFAKMNEVFTKGEIGELTNSLETAAQQENSKPDLNLTHPQATLDALKKQAAKQYATENKMQSTARGAVVQRDLHAQVSKQADTDLTGLKPGEEISARVTVESGGSKPTANLTFDFSRPITKEQAAAIIFQKGQPPEGELVQGDGNKWIVQFPNSDEAKQRVLSHLNSHKETIRTRNRAPGETEYPKPELKMTWTGDTMHTTSTGPRRSDLSGEYGFKITKRYPLDEGQSPDLNVRSAVRPGSGYEMTFEKPMTKDQVMAKLFEQDKMHKGQVRLIPIPKEPATTWQVQLLDVHVPLTKEAGYVITDSNVYGKETFAPGLPAGIRNHIDNKTVPDNAKQFPPDAYVWEQDGHIVRVETNGKKGADGYYQYEETKLSPKDKQGNDTMRWLMMEKGLPVREAWQEYIRHWDQIHIGMLGMVGGAASMPRSIGRPPIMNPRVRGRVPANESSTPGSSTAKGSNPQEPVVVKNPGTLNESTQAKKTTTTEPMAGKTEPEASRKRTTMKEDEEIAAAKKVKVSNKNSDKLNQLSELEKKGKVTGDVEGLKKRLRSGDPEGLKEFEQIKNEIAEGKKPHIEDYEDYGPQPVKFERMSDSKKMELQESAWLKKKLPDVEDRREFMKWLEKRHTQENHKHLNPGSPYAEKMLLRWSEEEGKKLQ